MCYSSAPGAKVEAVMSQGVVVGCAVVREDGMFGLFAAFGADPGDRDARRNGE